MQPGKSVYADTGESDKQKCDLLLSNWHKDFYFLDGVNTGLVRKSIGGSYESRHIYTRDSDEQMTNSDKFKLISLVKAMEITLGRKLIRDKWFYER